MTRWIGALIVAGCLGVMNWCPVEAKDRPVVKSLARTGLAAQGNSSRVCADNDLLGNWQLVAFDSSYRFRNPQAPYLFPHQVFQYSNQGGAKSVHSLRPILGSPDQVFGTVPPDMIYRVEGNGRVILKTKGREGTVETWSCTVVIQGREMAGGGSALQSGDLVMTLLGSDGQALFVRHLRKSVGRPALHWISRRGTTARQVEG